MINLLGFSSFKFSHYNTDINVLNKPEGEKN